MEKKSALRICEGHEVILKESLRNSKMLKQRGAVFEKTCEATKKNVKSHVFWILKKNVKT